MSTVNYISIDRIKSHAQCPLRGQLEALPDIPLKVNIRKRIYRGISSLMLMGLGKDYISDNSISDIAVRTFEGIEPYDGIDNDIKAAMEVYGNLSVILNVHELKIVDAYREFEISYGGNIVKSYVDGIVEDQKTGKKLPIIVDITRARYDVMYSAAVYHAQTVVDLYGYHGPSTKVVILSPGNGKKWTYDHDTYSGLVKEAIELFAEDIEQERICANIGMHCTWCGYRGICHTFSRS